ncbi:MAG TPA: S1 RNA-binding domain-containing protein, partial [Gaiellaceae bacterium]
ILPGVEGLVHISELAAHHVENPREVVSQGDAVNVRILEIDGERRRLSLSLKRVEEGDEPVPRADGAESVHTMPDLRLSEEAFPTTAAALQVEGDEADVEVEEADVEAEAEGDVDGEIEAGVDVAASEAVVEAEAEAEAEAEKVAEEVVAEVELADAELEEAAEAEGGEVAVEAAAEQQSDSD